MIDFGNKKVLFIDLDSTLIKTVSGKTFPGDFSDSDKKCAENFGIDYIDVRDFLEL